MLTKDEIDAKGKEFIINSSDVQRDYIFGWVLQGIYSESILGENLILKGGNALRKAYYPDTRFSKDLDFSVQSDINPDNLKTELKKLTKYLSEKTGAEFHTEQTQVLESEKFRDINVEAKQIYEARLYFKSFYGEEMFPLKIQLDITSFDEIILPIQKPTLIHPYPDFEECKSEIKVQKLEEILASKMAILFHRRKVTDLFDLGYSTLVSNKYEIRRTELLKVLLRKLLKENDPISARQEFYSIPLEEFRAGWDDMAVPALGRFGFELIESKFRSIVDDVFSSISVSTTPTYDLPSIEHRGFNSAGSFGEGGISTIRNTIITSGRNRNLVEIIYDGLTRLVEPYALEYRVRKKDGIGLEYFWAYDQSGGKSGRVGIKMFIFDKLESAKNIESPFTPRFEVEF